MSADTEWVGDHAKRIKKGLEDMERAAFLAGVRAGIERCAAECDSREVLNAAVEGETDWATDAHTGVVATASGHRAIECRECAYAIRALDPESVEVK